jgi:hypothetical protein
MFRRVKKLSSKAFSLRASDSLPVKQEDNPGDPNDQDQG